MKASAKKTSQGCGKRGEWAGVWRVLRRRMADSLAGGLQRCIYLKYFNGRGSQRHRAPYELEQVQ